MGYLGDTRSENFFRPHGSLRSHRLRSGFVGNERHSDAKAAIFDLAAWTMRSAQRSSPSRLVLRTMS